jgi:hypothetical protein
VANYQAPRSFEEKVNGIFPALARDGHQKNYFLEMPGVRKTLPNVGGHCKLVPSIQAS